MVAELITVTRGSERPVQLYKPFPGLASGASLLPNCVAQQVGKASPDSRERKQTPSLKCAAIF